MTELERVAQEAIQGAAIAEITLAAHQAGCRMTIRESYTGLSLTCLSAIFPSFQAAALAIAEAFAPPAPHAKILERIMACARTSPCRE